MSNGISGYFVPNKIANSYVANKRTNTGELEYEGALQDVGMETQAAIQSLNKTYSNVVNDAYLSYLNSKQNISSSNLGQGYKEAYIQQQEQALQENIAQANLTASETKQDILKQQYETEAKIGQAFQQEVINMEKVSTNLSGYMDYLKTITKDGVSYYDAIVQGHGLENIDNKIGIQAEDIYDALYNAQPLGYTTEDSKAGMTWQDWLKTQIKTEKDQTWYDWYIGQGGYEQFQDAYRKGSVGTVADRLAEEAEQARLQREEAALQQEYNLAKYKAQQEYNQKLENINGNNIIKPFVDLGKGDYGVFDFGKTAHEKIVNKTAEVDKFVKSLGLSDSDIKKYLGYNNVNEMLEAIADAGDKLNKGYSFEEIIKNMDKNYLLVTWVRRGTRSLRQGDTQTAVEGMFNDAINDLIKYSYMKREGIPKEFTFQSYEDWKASRK